MSQDSQRIDLGEHVFFLPHLDDRGSIRSLSFVQHCIHCGCSLEERAQPCPPLGPAQQTGEPDP